MNSACDTKIRVRYSRLSETNRTPKNTLVTVKDGDTVYFGIARCNRDKDTFNKKVGGYIAAQRAELVKEDTVANYDLLGGNVKLHKSGLRGCVDYKNIKAVINYFKMVDEYCLAVEQELQSARSDGV